jgi:ABC-2 type transport system ATP-binding protein
MCDRIGIIQGGVIRACGTMADLRASASSGTEGLEQIFLRLTGENAARALVDVLDA